MSTGRISWFGGPADPSSGSQTASGASINAPGIAVYNQATLGGWWLVRMPNGRQAVLQQTDIGPAPWTGRAVDFTFSALPSLGYSTSNFPTDAAINYTYLGKQVPPQMTGLVIGAGGASSPTSSSIGGSPGAYGGLGGFLLKATLTLAFVAAGLALATIGARSTIGARKR